VEGERGRSDRRVTTTFAISSSASDDTLRTNERASAMEAQVLKSLVKLRKITTRSHKELRDVIDAAQASMTAAVEKKNKQDATAASGGIGGANEVPFEPFLLACLTRHAKLVAVALDCIEKFLAFGFLKGNGSIPDGIRKRLVQKSTSGAGGGARSGASAGDGANDGLEGGTGAGSSLNEENWKLIDCIVDVICDCNDHPDETVQIQVLRVLLTAVTTTTCEVHEHSLLKAVRACYHIHLVSKNQSNQMVAKATLQQIISIVFQRRQTFAQRVQE
jgi:brefeldin A-inhibited guanine nucleotide-exchange protein